MNQPFRTDAEIDSAIDAVARQLTIGRPRAGFARRVRAKLEGPAPRRAWNWRLAGAVAAALVVVAVLVGSFVRGPVAPAPTRSVARAPAPLDVPEPPSPVEPVTSPRVAESAPARRLLMAPDAPALPPLAEPAPLAVMVNSPAEIVIKEPQLGLNDLAIGDLRVAPLDAAKEPR